jgi:hypothetical protein
LTGVHSWQDPGMAEPIVFRIFTALGALWVVVSVR